MAPQATYWLNCLSLFVFSCLFSLIDAQYDKATTTDAAGNHLWTPQPIANPNSVITIASTPAAAQPTLVWNCERMPSICTNLYNYLIKTGGTGTLPGPVEMVYDFDSKRTKNRRGRMCNSNIGSAWGTRVCPDTNLPVNNKLYDPLPAGYDQGFYVSNVAATISGADNWIIPGFVDANGNNVPSGLMYTCDEYPPASWVNGGTGEQDNDHGTVICAASGMKCLNSKWTALKGLFFNNKINLGEQDWQGQSHNLLRGVLEKDYGLNKKGIVKANMAAAFQFTTSTMAPPVPGDATTHAVILRSNDPDKAVYTKRDMATANPTPSYWTEQHGSSQHLVIGVPAHTPAPTSVSSAARPMMTTITRAGTVRITVAGGPTVRPNETVALTSVMAPMESSSPSAIVSRLLRRAPLYDDVTEAEIVQAEALVKAAIDAQSTYNAKLFQNPRRNVMEPSLGVQDHKTKRLLRRDADMPNYSVNASVAAAAALLAELQAAKVVTNLSETLNSSSASDRVTKRDTPYWLESLNHNGKMAFNANSSTYSVWRNVQTYGADPTGVLDSTEAINNAISDGYRCGAGCNSSSVTGALVYFPPGTYLVSSSIIAMYNTQLVGDPTDPPTILAASSFVGLGVISSDVYIDGGDGAEWYINQNNFLRQIRNFIIDIRQATVAYPAGLHWQVAQGTSLQNIEFIQNTGTQQGIFAENGSGGWMSDLVFTGGNFGMYGGNQQFTVRNLRFTGCTTAIGLIWDWGWTWKDLYIDGCGTGINMVGEGGARNTGSVYILDSTFVDTGVALLSTVPLSDVAQGTTSIVLDNVVLQDSPVAVQDSDGNTILAGGTAAIDFWTLGRVYNADHPDGGFIAGESISPVRPLTSSLRGTDNGGYFVRSKPQYETYTASQVVNVKTYAGAKGDGVSDDTGIIQSTLDDYRGQDVIIWFPAGSYIVTDTIVIPEGTKIVGEVWSQIMASGAKFSDMAAPRVMVQVGNVGDVGSVEIQDMMFTTKGGTAGAVLMEWNIKAESPGSAAMWDSHFRIGGAQGNELQVDQCPAKSTDDINTECIAGSMLLHLTSSSSAYLENIWAWTADHDMDDAANTMVDVYVARGILIESKGPTWLYGTASEHNVLYQYELYGAENIFMGMIQTESPYYPPVPNAPTPFEDALGAFDADPDFSNCANEDEGCAVSWALRMVSSENIEIAGAGLYSWYQDHDPAEACVDSQDCQQRLISTYLSSQIWLYNLITIGAVEMVSPYGSGFTPALAADNTDATGHPWWSTIGAWLLLADGADANDPVEPGQTVTVADWWWAMSTPSASCWFPCVLELPPLTLPAIQPPVITSVIGGDTLTITPPATSPTVTVDPITITGTPSISNAATSVETVISFTQSAIEWPAFTYTDEDDNSQHNISGILIPLPLKGPPPRANWKSDDEPSDDSSHCVILCDWPLKISGINIVNSHPWPKIDVPPPPELEVEDDTEDYDTDGGGGSDDNQPQEPETSSSSTTTTTTTTSTSTTSTTTTTTSSEGGCSVIPTIAIATDGVAFATVSGAVSASAWASSYPTAAYDQVFGGAVSIGGVYTPVTIPTILTNPGTSTTTTTASTTTTSQSSPPTNTSGGKPRYDIIYYEDGTDPDAAPVMKDQGYGSYTDANWDMCSFSTDWEQTTVYDIMPSTMDEISVFGDTCSYAATSDWSSADDDAAVGKLICNTWGQATCWKGSTWGSCLGTISSPFQLTIDHPNKLFARGDTITGAVSGWDPTHPDGSSVHIILEGRSKSYIRLKGQLTFNYKDRSPLIYQVAALKPSDYDADRQHARFAVTIPETVPEDLSRVAALTQDKSYWTHSWTELEGFEQEGGYPLPPSTVMAKQHLTKFSSTVYGWGYVRYTITAIRTWVEEGHGRKKDKKKVIAMGSSQKVIWMTTRRIPDNEGEGMKVENPTIVEQSLTFSTKRLDPSIGDRKRSFRETLGGMFGETPTLQFQPVITVPKVAVVGESARLLLRLEVLPPTQKGVVHDQYPFPLPPITLKEIKLRLKDTISVRCKGSAVTNNYHYDFPNKNPTEQSLSPGYMFNSASDGKAYQDTAYEVMLDIPSSCTPTHRTCNFNKTWKIKGEAVLACFDKETTAVFKSEVELISRPRRRTAAGGQVDGEAVALMVPAEDEEDEEDAADVLEMATAFIETVNAGLEFFSALASV